MNMALIEKISALFYMNVILEINPKFFEDT